MPRTFDLILVSAVAGCGTSGAAIDLWVRRVPNPLTLGIAALGLVLAATHGTGIGIGGALAGLGVGLLLMLPSYVIGATGGGDVKLLAAVSLFAGPPRLLDFLAITALMGGVLGLAILAGAPIGRPAIAEGGSLRTRLRSGLPYGPAIAAGGLWLVASLGLG